MQPRTHRATIIILSKPIYTTTHLHSYIIECVNAGSLLPLKRVHLLGMSAETRKQFRGSADVFGDR